MVKCCTVVTITHSPSITIITLYEGKVVLLQEMLWLKFPVNILGHRGFVFRILIQQFYHLGNTTLVIS